MVEDKDTSNVGEKIARLETRIEELEETSTEYPPFKSETGKNLCTYSTHFLEQSMVVCSK